MKYDEMVAMMAAKKKNRPQRHRHIEGNIQEGFVTWFRYAFPQYIIFSVPNGGTRNAREAVQLKKEGALAGVSDLVVVIERFVLFVETKTKNNKQQESQKLFQQNVERLGHTYVVCHNSQEFQLAIHRFIKEKLGI